MVDSGDTIKYKHALALNPYLGDTTAAMGIFPPTGLEYIAASMEGLVGKVTLLDLRYELAYRNLDALRNFISSDGVDLICISIQWHSRFEKVCEFLAQLPAEVCTVVGGYKATQEVENIFERCPNVDLIVRGEGEETIAQVVTGVPHEDILGLSYRRNGQIVHNDNHPLPDVAKIRFPDRSLRRHDYRAIAYGVPVSSHRFDAVLTTRGCPFKCKFCTFSLNPLGQKRSYTERPIESVIEELKTVTADTVLFSDDNFFTNHKRAERLCDSIVENNIKKRFLVQTRIDVARHPTTLEKAQKAGIKVFLIGIESPHDWILEQLQKGITQQQIRQACEVFSHYDFYLHGYFIYGNIGETREEMLYISKFAKELKLDSISFQKLRIEKFSPLQEIVEQTPGYHFDRVGGPVYSESYGHKELKQIRNQIRAGFYDAGQLLRIAKKASRIGLVGWRDLAVAVPNIPRLTYKWLERTREKKKMHRNVHAPSTAPRRETQTVETAAK